MECITKLQAALAAVPVSQQPCTAAVRALHVAGHAAARQIFPAMYAGVELEAPQMQQACSQQQLPGACMPVLAWLVTGLSSGLPLAASQQAHEMVCVLLGVVSVVVPKSVRHELWGPFTHGGTCSQSVKDEAVRLLQQLGADTGACLTPGSLTRHVQPSVEACAVRAECGTQQLYLPQILSTAPSPA
jgi:hypothetical protein